MGKWNSHLPETLALGGGARAGGTHSHTPSQPGTSHKQEQVDDDLNFVLLITD